MHGGFGAARDITPRIADDALGKDDERLAVGAEVAVPTGHRIERLRQRIGQAAGLRLLRLELDERPDDGLTREHLLERTDPCDLADGQG